MMMKSYAGTIALLAHTASAWNVAVTPPMGFNTWNLYHCSIDAQILTDTASAMVKTGLKDAGYIFVNSDDCWMSFNRSADGNQVPDPTKFPNGFKAVADFIHGLGMKSGLYTAKGPHTCQKRAASCLHEAQDAKAWASWGIDYVKDDSCSTCVMANGTAYSDLEDYGRMWQAIEASGRPMILTVEGSPPDDIITHGGYGNAKRVGHDISPSWSSMISLVDIGSGLWMYAHGSVNATYGGWWNDLDMIEIGNGGGTDKTALATNMFPWAVQKSMASNGWTQGSDGSMQNSGLCLTAGGTVTLAPCDATNQNQKFKLESNGNLHLASNPSDCFALQGGTGPGLVMYKCNPGVNEEFSLQDGYLCSQTLAHPAATLCLKPENATPPHGGGGNGEGFDCIMDPAALARCQVHFTMWTIMKAPLLLGNNIPEMDDVALSVVKNPLSINISQDSLGNQAQRVWASSGIRKPDSQGSAAAVVTHCNSAKTTQQWNIENGMLHTRDEDGVDWCLRDVHGTEEVGSWRGVPCSTVANTPLDTVKLSNGLIAIQTPSNGYLTWNNAHGASGPIAHSRYLASDSAQSPSSAWHKEAIGTSNAFRMIASDKRGIRSDNKMGGITFGGEFCLDLANDGDQEVWAGLQSGNRWAVALLNRDSSANSTITVNYTMFNSTATTSFAIHDIWANEDMGSHTGSYSATVGPQAVKYLLLTPA